MARNVAVATSRESGAQHLAAWLQPADGDHKSPLAANGDLKVANERRAKNDRARRNGRELKVSPLFGKTRAIVVPLANASG